MVALKLPQTPLHMIAGLLGLAAEGHVRHQRVRQFAIGGGDIPPQIRALIVVFVFDGLDFLVLVRRRLEILPHDLVHGLAQRQGLDVAVERVLRAHPAAESAGKKRNRDRDQKNSARTGSNSALEPHRRGHGAIVRQHYHLAVERPWHGHKPRELRNEETQEKRAAAHGELNLQCPAAEKIVASSPFDPLPDLRLEPGKIAVQRGCLEPLNTISIRSVIILAPE